MKIYMFSKFQKGIRIMKNVEVIFRLFPLWFFIKQNVQIKQMFLFLQYFFYNLYLKSIKLFSLKACSLDETTLLKMTSSGTGWKQARVDIPVDNHGRQIIFEAERGNSASDVAIDDVSLSNKECPPGNFFILFSCNIHLIQR